jgi:hypothetical protein
LLHPRLLLPPFGRVLLQLLHQHLLELVPPLLC